MVCLERWFGYSLLLILYLTVHQYALCMQPRVPNNNISAKEWKNSSESPPLNATCNDLLQPHNHCNETSDGEASCSQNVTTTPLAPAVFPQEATNGMKIVTCNSTIKIGNENDNVSGTNDSNTQNATDLKLTSDENANSTANFNETNINNNETESISICLNGTIQTDGPGSANDSSSKIDTEIPDLLKSDVVKPIQVPDVPPKIVNNSSQPQTIDTETETVEDGKDTEDTLKNSSAREGSSSLPGVPLVQGQLAAILAGVFVIVSVIAYVGLLSWRRFLEALQDEYNGIRFDGLTLITRDISRVDCTVRISGGRRKRYGNREMLVNEEEFNDDLRHFSI